MKKFTAQAATIEEAISIALSALQISREESEIIIEEEGRKGFLGIGQKDAVVTVTAKESQHISPIEELDLFPENKSETRTASKEEEDLPTEEATTMTDDSFEAAEPQQVGQDQMEEEEKDVGELAEGELSEDDINAIDNQAIQDAEEYIQTIGRKLGAEDITVSIYRELENVYFDLETDKPGIIIGRHGKVLDAIHTLTQILLRNRAHSKLNARLDAENYRGRKEESLKSLAERTAEKVIATNQPQILEAMPAKERKIIHRILSSNDSVVTYSEGEEPERYLVVESAEK